MKIKDCIVIASQLLNLGEDHQGKTSAETDKLLLLCANNCLDEITSEYFPLIQEKSVKASDGKIPYSLLGETVYDVIHVKKGSDKVDFELLPTHIKVAKEGEYTVKYCTSCGKLDAEDEIPISLHITSRVIAYGIASEYMLINGFYEEAVTFDKLFKDALIRAAYGRKERRVKSRRWLL